MYAYFFRKASYFFLFKSLNSFERGFEKKKLCLHRFLDRSLEKIPPKNNNKGTVGCTVPLLLKEMLVDDYFAHLSAVAGSDADNSNAFARAWQTDAGSSAAFGSE